MNVLRPTQGVFVIVLAVAAACGGGSTSPTPGTPGTPGTPAGTTPVVTTAVTLLNSAFTPPDIQVAPSATVTFTNNDNLAHNVTFALATITPSGDYTSGSKAISMPAAAGTYTYRCTLHAGMNGSVKVQ